MVTYMKNPTAKVVVGAVTFEENILKEASIIRNENGFDLATCVFVDDKARNRATIVKDAAITIYVKDRSETSWTTLFTGIIRFTTEQDGPAKIIAHCDGSGYGLNETVCGQEYGSQSNNPTLDTLKEIITDATNGVVPKWVNKILGTATASGYAYVTDSGGTDYIDNIAGTILYLYFAYKPNLKVFQDICDLSQAIQAGNAGPHWIVTTDSKILLTTVGNHSAASIAQGWTTYMNGSQALATLTYGVDFTEDTFETLNSAANYILYHGRFRKPANGDLWTENNEALWGHTDATLTNENTIVKVGSYSLKVEQTATPSYVFYPSAINAAWAISKLGGKYNIPTIGFWMYKNTGKVDAATDYFRISLVTPAASYFYLDHLNPTEDAWTRYDLQLGDYANTGSNAVEWSKFGAATWTEIDYLTFTFVSAEATRLWYLDGLSINGWVKRGAKNSTLIGTDKLKLVTINDDYAKDDSIIASDDTGTIGRMAYAELLRRQSKPIVATLQTPMQRNALAGQLLHAHARPNSAGTWQINADMRITQLTHRIQGKKFRTVYTVTSDVINSMTRPAYDSLNQTLANYRPESQDRQAANIKLRDIDITQAILEKDYP